MAGDPDPLALFSPSVAAWFRATWPAPTPPQAAGWPAIARGEHALIVSPTGSGKTLTAFLWSLDRLFRELAATPEPPPRFRALGDFRPGVRVVYVSPLKALNYDVERNLQVPLAGIRAAAQAAGQPLAVPRVAVRTGDTPANERQQLLRRPPQILITTPESLYLLLTSPRARLLFATAHTVIVDEIHTLVGNKRGAHLALSLERLTRLAAGPLQRVGLSATVRPVETAARFLGGQDPQAGLAPRPVTVVDAAYPKPLDLRVVSPVEDFRALPGGSVWPAIIPAVAGLIAEHRTTLIFCNNRRLAERTADRLNEYRLAERDAERGRPARQPGVGDQGMFAAGIDEQRLAAAGLRPIRAHHGSLSKVARLALEADLKAGRLPALVATSSLELGLDVGEIDLVVHLQSPKSVASGLQRVGRSGHLVGQTSVGRFFPTHVDDLIEAAAVARGMRRGEIEAIETPENPLDVLAQQLVAMVSVEDWSLPEALALVRGAYPFRSLGDAVFRSVLEMLSGKYPESISRHLRARIAWDRLHDRLAALPGAGLVALGSGGTIPDRGTYALVLADRHTRVGELDEEFVFETRPGDPFLFGAQVWRTLEITEDRVIAEPAPGEVPRMPFWRGDIPWRPYDLGRRIGAFRRQLAELVQALTPAELEQVRAVDAATLVAVAAGRPIAAELAPASYHLLAFLVGDCALDRNAAGQAVDYVVRQLEAVGAIATDRTVVVETFDDALGEPRLVVHSPFGGRVNGPWAIALAGALRERLGVEAQVISGDDGLLLRFANADAAPPVELVARLTSAEARERLLADLPGSATFGAQFRMNAARALLLPRERAGQRTPLWLARLRAKDLLQAVLPLGDFPLVLETYRDCLRDVMDLASLTAVLDQIQRGEIAVVTHEATVPSPVAASLDYRFALQYVYEYDAPRGERQLAALSLNRALLADLLQDGTLAELLKPEAVAEVAARAARSGPTDRVRDVESLAQLLFELGDRSAAELQARLPEGVGEEWLPRLAAEGRVLPWRFGEAERWIHAEHRAEYAQLAKAPAPVLRRFLAHAGPTSAADLAARYALPLATVRAALASLGAEVVAGQVVPGAGEQWIDRRNLEQMHRRTLTLLRQEVQPVPVSAYAAFLAAWQRVVPAGGPGDFGSAAGKPGPDYRPLAPPDLPAGARTGRDRAPQASLDQTAPAGADLTRALQQLRGLALPGVLWERDLLPARVADFDPEALAERCQAGELIWVAEGGREARRAAVQFFFRGEGGLFWDRAAAAARQAELSEAARAVFDYLRQEGAALLPDVAEGTDLERSVAQAALVELALAGLVTNDSLAALRTVLGYAPPERAARSRSSLEAQLAVRVEPLNRRPSRHRLREARRHARAVVAADGQARRQPWVGRWSLVDRPGVLGKSLTDDERARRLTRQLLARWGVVTKSNVARESAPLSWDAADAVLRELERRGEVRRGYFVEGLPGVQFALPEVVDQLRAANRAALGGANGGALAGDESAAALVVLSAADPAQWFGAEAAGGPLRFARLPTTAVAAWWGAPVAVMEESGAVVRAVADHPQLAPALRALAHWWRARLDQSLRVERCGDDPILDSPILPALEAAGFVRDYRGMVWPD